MVTIQMIGKETEVTGNGYDNRVMPVKDNFISKEIKKKVGPYGISLNTYANASLWDGHPKYETAWGYGH